MRNPRLDLTLLSTLVPYSRVLPKPAHVMPVAVRQHADHVAVAVAVAVVMMQVVDHAQRQHQAAIAHAHPQAHQRARHQEP